MNPKQAMYSVPRMFSPLASKSTYLSTLPMLHAVPVASCGDPVSRFIWRVVVLEHISALSRRRPRSVDAPITGVHRTE
jgi:hypothetical protein